MTAFMLFSSFALTMSSAQQDGPDPRKYCASSKELARIVMEKRQEGAAREWMIATFDLPAGNVRQVMMSTIEASFLFPVEDTPAGKVRAAAEVADALHLNCMDRFSGRPE